MAAASCLANLSDSILYKVANWDSTSSSTCSDKIIARQCHCITITIWSPVAFVRCCSCSPACIPSPRTSRFYQRLTAGRVLVDCLLVRLHSPVAQPFHSLVPDHCLYDVIIRHTKSCSCNRLPCMHLHCSCRVVLSCWFVHKCWLHK